MEREAVNESKSGAMRVDNLITGTRGFAKPGPEKANETHLCRAAHEKIAFDLAFLLELPVPRVVLWHQGVSSPFQRGRCISAEAFAESLSWKEADAKGLIPSVQKANAVPIFSAMRVFHVWITDLDRNLSQVRYDLRCEGNIPGIAFVDHSHSMSWYWSDNGPEAPLLKSSSLENDLPETMASVADAVARLPAAKVERIVSRVGEPYLPPAVKSVILRELLDRKDKLRRRLKLA